MQKQIEKTIIIFLSTAVKGNARQSEQESEFLTWTFYHLLTAEIAWDFISHPRAAGRQKLSHEFISSSCCDHTSNEISHIIRVDPRAAEGFSPVIKISEFARMVWLNFQRQSQLCLHLYSSVKHSPPRQQLQYWVWVYSTLWLLESPSGIVRKEQYSE